MQQRGSRPRATSWRRSTARTIPLRRPFGSPSEGDERPAHVDRAACTRWKTVVTEGAGRRMSRVLVGDVRGCRLLRRRGPPEFEAGHDVVGVTMKTFCYSETPSARQDVLRPGRDRQDAKRVAAAPRDPALRVRRRGGLHARRHRRLRRRVPGAGLRIRVCAATATRSSVTSCGAAACSGATESPPGTTSGSADTRGGLGPAPRSRCGSKDQSYFLWGLPRGSPPESGLPPGMRSRSGRCGTEPGRPRTLVTADKPESQEICFVPTGDYRDLLKRRLGPIHPALEPGPIVLLRRDPIVGIESPRLRRLHRGAAQRGSEAASRSRTSCWRYGRIRRRSSSGPATELYRDEVVACRAELAHRSPPTRVRIGPHAAPLPGTCRRRGQSSS